MKGFLPLLFFCVTLYFADGYYFLLHDQDESEAHMYRENWDPFREGMLEKLEKDLHEGKKGPVTILGEALFDTIILFLKDTHNARSAEGQCQSVLSDLDFRDSSGSPRSGPPGEDKYITPDNTSNSSPVSGMHISIISQENDTNKTDEKCFVRKILDLISSLVRNAYDGIIRMSGQPPAGPRMLHLMVNKLNESLDGLNGIDVLDAALFKICELIKRLLMGVKIDLSSSSKSSPEVNSVVKFLDKMVTFLDDYIEANRETAAAGNSVPAIRLFLDQVEDVLEELLEGKTLTNSNGANSLASVRKFIDELRNTLKILVLGKWDDEAESSLLTQLLHSTKRVLGQIIQEMKDF